MSRTPLEFVRDWWDLYSARVIPPTTPAAQYAECRRAFYAGCRALLHQTRALGNPDVPDETAVDHLQAVMDELEQFNTDVREGRC